MSVLLVSQTETEQVILHEGDEYVFKLAFLQRSKEYIWEIAGKVDFASDQVRALSIVPRDVSEHLDKINTSLRAALRLRRVSR
jgi:hypothetical protein